MLYLPCDKGQGLTEYALILLLVAIAVIVLLSLLGNVVADALSDIADLFP